MVLGIRWWEWSTTFFCWCLMIAFSWWALQPISTGRFWAVLSLPSVLFLSIMILIMAGGASIRRDAQKRMDRVTEYIKKNYFMPTNIRQVVSAEGYAVYEFSGFNQEQVKTTFRLIVRGNEVFEKINNLS